MHTVHAIGSLFVVRWVKIIKNSFQFQFVEFKIDISYVCVMRVFRLIPFFQIQSSRKASNEQIHHHEQLDMSQFPIHFCLIRKQSFAACSEKLVLKYIYKRTKRIAAIGTSRYACSILCMYATNAYCVNFTSFFIHFMSAIFVRTGLHAHYRFMRNIY